MSDSLHDLAPSTSRHSDVLPRAQLTRRDRDAMFALYTRYFATGDRLTFDRDLAEKEWVILLRDGGGTDANIEGFSTLMRMHVGEATIFFSGDTIVDRARWGSYDLPRLWGRHVFAHAGENAYWFLISSGYRTYRYLPLFFRDFYPRDRSMKPLLDRVAAAKFADTYDARTGVVRLASPAPLRDGVSDPASRMHDPHVRFFVEANPGHADGDELACLVRIAADNLTPAGLRMLGRR